MWLTAEQYTPPKTESRNTAIILAWRTVILILSITASDFRKTFGNHCELQNK